MKKTVLLPLLAGLALVKHRCHPRRAALALAAVISTFLIAGGVGSAATNADWTGHWSFVDNCTSGPGCPGVYAYEIDFVQTGGSVTGTGSPYTTGDGSASGSTLTFTAVGSGTYRAPFHMTMSADGKSATGTATDSDGRKFTVTATGSGKPATPDPAPKPGEYPSLPPATNANTRLLSVGTIPKGAAPRVYVTRDGKTYLAGPDATLQKGDKIRTDKHTVLALEFLIGGRVGLAPGTEVEIVNDRSVASTERPGFVKLIQNTGSMAVFMFDEVVHPRPDGATWDLQIQTNGGVTGIKG